MGRFETIKTTIDANIKENGSQEITGQIMNNVLTEVVNATDAELTELESEQEINTSWIKNTAYELAINQIVKYDGLELSDYIYLNGRKIIITSDSVGGFGGVFFNKQFSAISCFETRNLNNAQIDVPQDAVWMRVTNNYYVGECTIKISKTTNISPISLQKIDFEKVNGYINVDGTFVSDFADFYTSDFFIIHKGDVVVVKANGTEGVVSTLSLYNEKREFVKSLANGSYNDLLYRAETNTEYLRFSARLSTSNECRIIRQNQNPLVEVPFNLLIDEKYIASKENGRYYDMSLYEISQNIQAHAGDIISTQCYGMDDMVSLISEWRKDGSYVKTLIHGSKDGVISEYLVEHDMFFRICRRKAQGIKVYIQKNASKQDEQTSLLNKQLSAYAIQEYSQNERNVINTSIALCRPICIGDSLTEGVDDAHNGRIIHENYPYFLSRLLSTNVVNAGIAGSNPITWYNSERGYRKINFYEHDSMIMWFGTNGGLTDTIDEDTAGGNPDTYAETNTGYYCKIIEKAMQAHPDMVIVLCTIYISGGSVDTTNLVIHKIAEKYNCIIVDMSDLGNLQNTCPPYLHPTKGIHFGKAGNIFIANRINNELRKLFMQDYSLMEFGVSVMES